MLNRPVGDTAALYDLTSEQRAYYRENGHVLIKGVIAPEAIGVYKSRIHEVVRSVDESLRSDAMRADFGGEFLELTNLWELDAAVRQLTFAPRLAKLAADLLEADAVRLHYDCALFKGADAGMTPWHQDQVAWHLDTDRTITMWMPLTDLPAELGSLSFLSGSHRMGPTTLMKAVRQGLEQINYGPMQAGDATFHAGWTLHSAGDNPTNRIRDVFAVVYYADGARLTDPGDDAVQQAHMRRFFPGMTPGEPAAGAKHPLLYRRNGSPARRPPGPV